MGNEIISLLTKNMHNAGELINEPSHFFFGTFMSACINTIILLVFAIGVIIIVRGWLIISLENRALSKVRGVFKKSDFVDYKELMDEMDKVSLSPKRSVIKAVFALREVKERAGNVEVTAETIKSNYVPSSSWGRFLGGILIILGLIGTILGLSDSVVSLKNILSDMGSVSTQADFKAATQQILTSLSCMETAFSTTLFGFGAFLLLSFFDQAFKSKTIKFAHGFEDYVSNSLVPYFCPANIEESLHGLTMTLESSTMGLKSTSEGIGDLVALASENQAMFGQLSQSLHQTVLGVHSTQADLSKSYQELENITRHFLDSGNKQEAARKKDQQLLENLFQKLSADKNQVEDLYQKLSQGIQTLGDSFGTGLASVGKEVKEAVDRQNQQINRIEQDHDRTLKNTQDSLLELTRQSANLVEENQEVYQKETRKVSDVLVRAGSVIESSQKDLVVSLKNGFEEILVKMAPFNESMVDGYITGFDELSKNLLDKLTLLFDTMNSRMDSLEKATGEAVHELLPQVSGMTLEIMERHQAMLKEAGNQVEMAHACLEGMERLNRQNFGEEFKNISSKFQETMQNIEDLNEDFLSKVSDKLEEMQNATLIGGAKKVWDKVKAFFKRF